MNMVRSEHSGHHEKDGPHSQRRGFSTQHRIPGDLVSGTILFPLSSRVLMA